MVSGVKRLSTFGWLLMICGAVAAQAAVITVPTDQPTIQAAIRAAVNGDTVQVSPGTYLENINFLGKAIQVISVQGPQVTVIDGNQAGPVVTFNSGEGPQSVLSGFTLQNGKAAVSPALRGGGIRIENSSPTITRNIITNNIAGDGGGGISSSFSSPVIRGNTITNNGQIPGWSGGVGGGGVTIVGASAAVLVNNTIAGNSWSASGGGITLFAAGTPTLQNNIIANNSAASRGGGIWMVNYSDASIVQNLITGNSAPVGGGVYWLVPSGNRGPFLINNTISSNDSPQGSGVFADGFDQQVQLINNIVVAALGQNAVVCGNFDASTPSFQFNDVVAPSGSAYAGICSDQTGLNGNISADPLFKDPGTADYHLLPGSSAIDSGTSNQAPQTDFDGAVRPTDGNGDGVPAIDMGIYEAPALDSIPPSTMATVAPSPNLAGWNTTGTTVTLAAADNAGGSGVQAIRYWLSGAQTAPVVTGGNPASVSITAEGTTTVGYSAVDNAGNTETSKSLAVQIDKTNPVIFGMPAPGCTLSPPKHQLVQVAVITATDSRAGVASLNVTAASSERDSGTGGGDVPGDIIINGGTVQLRAERSPSGKGRIYTITATAIDVAGNSVTAVAACTVPK
jgi:parallel beta-helix repeat protein